MSSKSKAKPKLQYIMSQSGHPVFIVDKPSQASKWCEKNGSYGVEITPVLNGVVLTEQRMGLDTLVHTYKATDSGE